MSVWHVLDRYGTNLLHYKTIREVEIAKDLDDIAKEVRGSDRAARFIRKLEGFLGGLQGVSGRLRFLPHQEQHSPDSRGPRHFLEHFTRAL